MPYSKERRDAAFVSGRIPLDCYPEYVSEGLRDFVGMDQPLLETLCELFPEREARFVDEWCRRGRSEAWAWDEVWAKLNRLVHLDKFVPRPLSRFAMVPRPPRGRGAGKKEARDFRLAYLAEGLIEEGFTEDEMWDAFKWAFPKPELKDPRDSFRKLRDKGSPWLCESDHQEEELAHHSDVEEHAPPELPSKDAWVENPEAAAQEVLSSRMPPLVVLWHLSEGRCEERTELWRRQAREHAWLWDELRALLNWLIYRELPRPGPLRRFARQARPGNPDHRPGAHSSQLRAALVGHRLEELGLAQDEVVKVLADGWSEPVEESTIRRYILAGRDLILDFLRGGFGGAALPWPHASASLEDAVEFRRFDSDRYYRPTDPELGIIGTPGTLAHRRHRGAGPRWVAWGNRVFYRGSELNAFLDEHAVVLPGDEPDRSAATRGSEAPSRVSEPAPAAA